MEDIANIDYRHAKRVFKIFNNKNFVDYHIIIYMSKVIHYYLLMYLKILKNMYLKEYKLDPAHFLSAPGLALQAFLKKTEIKLELLTYIDIFLMIKKGIRFRITHAINRYVKANNK